MNRTDTTAEKRARHATRAIGRAMRNAPKAAWMYPAVAAALYAVAVLVASIALHPILACTAELDNYVGQARQLSAGVLTNDGYHPLGYPVLVRLIAPLVGDFFLAARLVSALSAGIFVWATHHLVRNAFGTLAAWSAMASVAAHPSVVDSGMQMSSDMLAACAAAITLVLIESTIRERRLWLVFWSGIAFAFAYWTRYPAMALVIAILPALWMSKTGGILERTKRYLVFAIGAIIGLVPHCALTSAQFGRLFHDESWRSLAMAQFGRIAGGFDFDVLNTTRFDSWWSVIAYQPMTLMRQGAECIFRCFTFDLPMILTGYASRPAGWVEWVVCAAIPIGWVTALWLGRPMPLLGGLFSVVYLSAMSVVSSVWDRYVLLCLPSLLGAATSLLWLTGTALRRVPRVALVVQLTGASALVAYVAAGVPRRIDELQRVEPHAELKAISEIVAEHGPTVVIGTIMCQLAEHIPFVPVWLPRDYGSALDNREFYATDYVVRCAETASTSDMDYMVIGAVTFGGEQNDGHARIKALANAPLPPDFERVKQDDEVLVWRVRKPFTSQDWRPESAGWRPSVRVAPNPFTRSKDNLRIEVDCARVASELSSIDLLVTDPEGTSHDFIDVPHVETGLSQTVGPAALMVGEWRMRARARLTTGLVYGPETVLIVR